MIQARTFFTDSERKAIDDAVVRAEANTSGEIVPVLAGSSGNYDRALFLAALSGAAVGTLGLVGLYLMPLPFLRAEPWAIPLCLVLPVQLLGLFLGYRAALSNEDVWRGFIPHRILQATVDATAKQAFGQLGLHCTRDATGILIYVSLFERSVVVLGDKAIAAKLPPETWKELTGKLTASFKEGKGAQGFVAAIEECGRILSQHFPIKADDTNELPNHLQIWG